MLKGSAQCPCFTRLHASKNQALTKHEKSYSFSKVHKQSGNRMFTHPFRWLAVLICLAMSAAGCGPSDAKYQEIALLPVGLEVIHTPKIIKAMRGGRSGHKYTWLIKTTIRSKVGPVTITEFGGFVSVNGRWVFSNLTGKPFTADNFAEWYNCSEAKLAEGRSYTDENNWGGGDFLVASKGLWYFIAVTPDGKRFKGEAELEQVAEVDPSIEAASESLAKGKSLAAKGEYDSAIAAYTETLRLDSSHSDVFIARAAAYYAKGDMDKTIVDCTEAIKLNPNLTAPYCRRASAFYKKREFDKAISDLTEAICLKQPVAELSYSYYVRGVNYGMQREYGKAIADITEALRLSPPPKPANAYYSRAVNYLRKGDFDMAIADYTEAIRLAPKFHQAYYDRGKAFQKKGLDKEAAADFAKARSLGLNAPPAPEVTSRIRLSSDSNSCDTTKT